MALIQCADCGRQISDSAPACPHCGKPRISSSAKASSAPEPAKQKKKVSPLNAIIGGCIIVIAASAIWGKLIKDDPKGNDDKQQCKKDDLQCIGGKGIVSASVYCQDAIEKLALHSMRWTDKTFQQRFSMWRWEDESKGIIGYFGDKAEFQNGFGAYTPITYECILEKDGETVVSAKIIGEGRLGEENKFLIALTPTLAPPPPDPESANSAPAAPPSSPPPGPPQENKAPAAPTPEAQPAAPQNAPIASAPPIAAPAIPAATLPQSKPPEQPYVIWGEPVTLSGILRVAPFPDIQGRTPSSMYLDLKEMITIEQADNPRQAISNVKKIQIGWSPKLTNQVDRQISVSCNALAETAGKNYGMKAYCLGASLEGANN